MRSPLHLLLVGTAAAAYSGLPGPRQGNAAAPPPRSDAPPDNRLEVAAAPRAEPKAKSPTPEPPLPLWGLPTPPEPRGPSVFKLNQGRAIDVLRRDYPLYFSSKPDLSIFNTNIELHDPSGKRLGGIKQYERVFDALRFLRRTTMQDAQVGVRLVADDSTVSTGSRPRRARLRPSPHPVRPAGPAPARAQRRPPSRLALTRPRCASPAQIRVRWNAKLWMRDPATGLNTMVTGEPALVHIDGVSIYDLDKDGLIYRHRLENIVFTGQEPALPVQLAFAWPTSGYATPELAVPFFKSVGNALRTRVAGKPAPSCSAPSAPSTSVRRAPPPKASVSAGDADDVPETPMQRAARERAEDEEKRKRLVELRTPKAKKEGGLFGLSAPQTCETSYDCDAPMVCCDLLFTTVCCTGGLLIPAADRGQPQMQRQAIPIPVEKPGPPQPPEYPGPPSAF